MGFQISKAGLADLNSLKSLVNSAYRGEEAKKGWTHEADLIEGNMRIDETTLFESINNPLVTILVCRDANQLLGCVYLEKKGQTIYLGMLSVSPLHQDKGIGKALLRASEDHALKEKCNKIEMTVISVRKELINWYQRQGYQLTNETRPFHDDGKFGKPRQKLEFIVLEKHLNSSFYSNNFMFEPK